MFAKSPSSSRLQAALTLVPVAFVVLSVYVGGVLWAAGISLTRSSMLPNYRFAGFTQYINLFSNARWHVSLTNMALFAVIFIPVTLFIGYSLAAMINRGVRGENALRTIYLYPFAMSFIVTGLVWRWLFDPNYGIADVARKLGFENASFDWIVNADTAIFTIIFAAVWHSSGLVMVVLLAGLRGVDDDLWKAIRIEGIPAWKAHLYIIVPSIGASITTALVLMCLTVVRLFDVVVAMTGGGPGIATDVPAKFIIDHMFERQQVGLASAAATTLLLLVLLVSVPLLYLKNRRKGVAE
ncbi:sugar ABC transporter permease [Rhizobium brockwellii]|uniref:Sugar ABC transporter permease n=1 Tax=Rhizobium brockwellii TaxID=3019932 RepID=A0ABU3YKQ0_9HYPH|nr:MULTISPECIES: sugar ABC transporter permease [Rhizobium]NKK54384.1 ABC transporter permease subunit [Rhizobium leguminosarum bv. viciae]MDV4179249.1 sugar ABC transporter permease [Rhizobium brockwellii]MDV4186441.1 sugar ABC transporter permease [Rhizobium brockwellii]TAU73778.1 sugar ABC transporter permease [Rhizobium leguminosarum]TAX03336.1 sugar ABC transporter permease [Rhizobium leguminosarum]